MPGFKKTKSNDALSTLRSARTVGPASPSILSVNNQNNQHLSYTQLRLSLRVVQVVCHVFLLGFTGAISGQLLKDNSLAEANFAQNFLGVIFLLMSCGLAALYVLKWLQKPGKEGHHTSFLRMWTGPRVLLAETIADSIVTAVELIFFSVYMRGIGIGTDKGNQCPVGVGGSCDQFNWILTWQFFTMLAWIVALGADVAGWMKIGNRSYSRTRDEGAEMEIRRLRMTRK